MSDWLIEQHLEENFLVCLQIPGQTHSFSLSLVFFFFFLLLFELEYLYGRLKFGENTVFLCIFGEV